MYFWNVSELTKRLKNNTLSAYEEAQQYFASLLLYTIGIGLPHTESLHNLDSALMGWLPTLGNILVLLCGIAYCYNINKTGDNKDFIKRMVCLAFPISLRITICALTIFFVIAGFVSHLFYEIHPQATTFHISATPYFRDETTIFGTIFDALYTLFWVTIYYWYTGKQLRKIAHL